MSTHSTNAPIFGALRPDELIRSFRNMFAVRKQRRDLAKLDDNALRDIGITRYEAHVEATRPAWDVPHYWLG